MHTPPLILAPMAGFTDYPFRLLCRRFGADFAVSEMISAKAMTYGDRKTAELSCMPDGDSPCAIQIFGHEPKDMAKAAKMLASGEFEGCRYAKNPVAIDINMGCPVKKIVASGDGSALMKDAGLCREIVSAVCEAVSPFGVPVTVKIRAGWDKSHKNAADIASACAAGGASAVTVHARTKEQMYEPGIDLDAVKSVRLALPDSVAVIGNGDVSCPEDAFRMLEYTGCDGIMIGRAALGDPWIFAEIKSAFQGRALTPPDAAFRINTARQFVADIVNLYGEETGVRMARGRAAHFIKGMRGAAEVRARLNNACTFEEFENALSLLG